MKLVLIGATDFVGWAILKEALDRGHEVTAPAFTKMVNRCPAFSIAHGAQGTALICALSSVREIQN